MQGFLAPLVFGGHGDDGLLQRFQLAVWPDVGGRWRSVDRWPDAAARTRVVELFQRLNTLEPAVLTTVLTGPLPG